MSGLLILSHVYFARANANGGLTKRLNVSTIYLLGLMLEHTPKLLPRLLEGQLVVLIQAQLARYS
jgi:hypothetical protein